MCTDQVTARISVRVLGAGQLWANLTTVVRSCETETDKALLITAAPSGQAWNGFLVKSAIGAGQVNYDAAAAAFAALSSPQKTAWDDAAEAVSPAFPEVAQMTAGNVPGTPMRTGEVFYHYAYGLYVAGLIGTVPGGTPPVYA